MGGCPAEGKWEFHSFYDGSHRLVFPRQGHGGRFEILRTGFVSAQRAAAVFAGGGVAVAPLYFRSKDFIATPRW